MSKLLDDEELQELLDDHLEEYYMDRGMAEGSTEKWNSKITALTKLYSLIQSQKQAHADMVIGEDEPQSENGLLPDRVDRRNQLRAEQRERNKL